MFHGLTMVNFDGQPWSDGQTVAGDSWPESGNFESENVVAGFGN